MPGRAPSRGYNGPDRFPRYYSNKWYQSRRLEKSEISLESYGDGGARERLRKVARGCVWLESWTRGLLERLSRDHKGCM